MRKLIMLLLLALAFKISIAQTSDTAALGRINFKFDKAGGEIIHSANLMTTSTILMLSGSVITLIGAIPHQVKSNVYPYTYQAKASSFITAVGIAVGFAGLLTTFSAHAHLGKAGKILRGNGIAIDIKPRKKY